jgi:hypothetical protein
MPLIDKMLYLFKVSPEHIANGDKEMIEVWSLKFNKLSHTTIIYKKCQLM